MKPIEQREFENPRLAERRRIVAAGLRLLFPADILDPQHGLVDAGNLVANGNGLVIVVNHFSYWDGPGAFVYVAAQSKAMIGKQWLAPVARHIYDIAQYFNQRLGTEINLKPVVTESTLKIPKYAHLTQGDGLLDYIRGARKTLDKGGVVVLFPQASRKPHLTEPELKDKAMRGLLETTSGISDYGILPVGFSIRGAHDYTKLSRINIGVTYEVKIGRLSLKSEVLNDIKDPKLSDMWVFHQLRRLVSENYVKLPSSGEIFPGS